MNAVAIILCPVCAMQHERTTTRTIFCRCNSAAAWDARRGWFWFRRGNEVVPPPPEPETETEARGCAGPEIDL